MKNNFYLKAFACMIVVFQLLVYMFGNPYVNNSRQQMVLLLVEWLSVEMEYFYYVAL